jgi:hypothetical protein
MTISSGINLPWDGGGRIPIPVRYRGSYKATKRGNGEGARGLPYTAVLKYLQHQRTTQDTLADSQRANLLKGTRGQNL